MLESVIYSSFLKLQLPLAWGLQCATMCTAGAMPIIRVPASTAGHLAKIKQNVKKQQRKLQLKRSQMGDRKIPLIVCRNKELNHYRGQTYLRFKTVPLASKGWHNKKAAGDYFTINSYGPNPAFVSIPGNESSEFDELGLHQAVVSQLSGCGFECPTNIQIMAIPHVLNGSNALISAETGNGKTLAYLAPLLQILMDHKEAHNDNIPFNSPLALVITPGRELAEQIHAVSRRLCEPLGLNSELVVGGKTKRTMLNPTVSTPHLIVCSFGAMSKLFTTKIYSRDFVNHIVLDEADTLLDDSFNEKMTYFLSKFPIQGSTTHKQEESFPDEINHYEPLSGVQLLLVAATTPRSLDSILQPVVDTDTLVKITTPYLHRLMPHVPQKFLKLKKGEKPEKLLQLVKGTKVPIIIFSNTAKTTDWATMFLEGCGIECINVHGDMSASLRKGRFNDFQNEKFNILSCTDVASRGLDTIRAGLIINYDFPHHMADYIHRCGRVGRVNSVGTGMVTNFIATHPEVELVQNIELAARKLADLPNVNANIKRILTARAMRAQELEERQPFAG
ncbi:putative ATP-dependent RNA helicase Dbp21E2 [Oratosquilla oratoria]|uniref:putative ATP-dependent RNA helicase Dbp21E2 n=1 Tax=Oratosquilla oratoria TaxID=337810 RepID=UPI003F762947